MAKLASAIATEQTQTNSIVTNSLNFSRLFSQMLAHKNDKTI